MKKVIIILSVPAMVIAIIMDKKYKVKKFRKTIDFELTQSAIYKS